MYGQCAASVKALRWLLVYVPKKTLSIILKIRIIGKRTQFLAIVKLMQIDISKEHLIIKY